MRDDFAELLSLLAAAPSRIRSLTGSLASEAVKYKPSADQFSILENVCHLRDIEIEGYADRIRRILNESDPELPDIDGGRLALERDYNRQDLTQATRDFVEARENNVKLLSAIDAQQLARTGNLQGVGTVTLERLLEMMIEHDEGHFDELQTLKRLVTPRGHDASVT